MAQIRTTLLEQNPWWKGEYSLSFKERKLYKQIQKFLPLPQMIAFTGLRRVGKTTLLLKIIDDSIKKGNNPKNILYFSFDEYKEGEIREILKEYETLLEKNLNKEKYLILFDEIQKLNNWEHQLKAFYDIHKNCKIIISGSESLFFKKKNTSHTCRPFI